MSTPPDAIAAVSQRLRTFSEEQRAELAGLGHEADAFAAAAVGAVQGGKRLRARFCLAGWAAASDATADPAPDDPVVAAAAALELFQAAALVHDDLIDNSDTRRGQPAAHRALEHRHVAAGWHGDAPAFGRAAAVLLGDLLVAWSDDLFEAGVADSETVRAALARREYARMRRDVTVGQFLDIAEESAFVTAPSHDHVARALRIASLKSARYSVEQPLVIGAALRGGDEERLAGLRAFGHPVGMAFQLRDDLLGVFGDSALTGKPAGDDLREGKRTVLVAAARERFAPAELARFDARFGDPELPDAQVDELQRLIADSGAVDEVESLIAGYAADAAGALERAAHNAPAARLLAALADAAIARSA